MNPSIILFVLLDKQIHLTFKQFENLKNCLVYENESGLIEKMSPHCVTSDLAFFDNDQWTLLVHCV